MPNPVFLIGSGRTDFKRNLAKEGKTLRDIIVEAARAAIDDAGIEPGRISSGVVGNFAAGQFVKQLHLGSYLVEVDEALRGIPTLHTEAACASGAVAMTTAIQQVMGGLYDCVLVVGAEQQKTMSPAEGADVLGAAGDFKNERTAYGEYMFPKLFGRIAQLYDEKYGLTDKQLACVASKNFAHARLNPLAQTRDNSVTCEAAMTESDKNPRIAPPLKITDCSQITDGAAAVVLCSESFLKSLGKKPASRLLGVGQSTDYLPLDRKDAPTFSTARKAARGAFSMAGLSPKDVHGCDVHDCFSITEIVAYEILGLAGDGQGAKLAESGATMHPSVGGTRTAGVPVVNPGGGLIGDGHPVGATGVRQVVEAHEHLLGRAGKRQIEGASTYLTFNMGGSLTTAVAMLWGKA
jgi:acetyl-CoA acetyltransferase